MAKDATVEDLLTRKRAATRQIELILDGALAEEWHAAKERLEAAKRQLRLADTAENKAAVQDAEDRVEELEPDVDEATVVMRLRSIGRRGCETLFELHQPTDDERRKARKAGQPEPQFNDKSFPAALIAASLETPKMTEEQVQELFDSDTYNIGELNLLFMAAMEVNQSSKVVSLGKGSGTTRD